MRYVLLVLLAGLISVSPCAFASIYEAPNAGNLNFYPMMQRQMEAQETLDFVNNPENYKQKREAKDNENKKRESHFDPNYTPNYGATFLHPVHPVQMQFTKDNDGSIKIKSINPVSSALKDGKE